MKDKVGSMMEKLPSSGSSSSKRNTRLSTASSDNSQHSMPRHGVQGGVRSPAAEHQAAAACAAEGSFSSRGSSHSTGSSCGCLTAPQEAQQWQHHATSLQEQATNNTGTEQRALSNNNLAEGGAVGDTAESNTTFMSQLRGFGVLAGNNEQQQQDQQMHATTLVSASSTQPGSLVASSAPDAAGSSAVSHAQREQVEGAVVYQAHRGISSRRARFMAPPQLQLPVASDAISTGTSGQLSLSAWTDSTDANADRANADRANAATGSGEAGLNVVGLLSGLQFASCRCSSTDTPTICGPRSDEAAAVGRLQADIQANQSRQSGVNITATAIPGASTTTTTAQPGSLVVKGHAGEYCAATALPVQPGIADASCVTASRQHHRRGLSWGEKIGSWATSLSHVSSSPEALPESAGGHSKAARGMSSSNSKEGQRKGPSSPRSTGGRHKRSLSAQLFG